MMPKYDTFGNQIHSIRQEFLRMGRTVDRQEWQSKRDDRPQTKVFEIHNVVLRVEVPDNMVPWQDEVQPNLPWAEDHFQERISGEPLNPGEQFKNWPWYEQGVEEHKETGEFSHTYMERFWARYNPNVEEPLIREGIRFEYGDLFTLTDLLISRPYTRQAYLPIWFPEDLTAANEGKRVPCTLGYHFQATPKVDEDPRLDIFYPMRSCDYFRYLRDDAYMAGRLLQHVATKVAMRPGFLTMHIANLHIFNAEGPRLRKEHEDARKEREGRLYGAF